MLQLPRKHVSTTVGDSLVATVWALGLPLVAFFGMLAVSETTPSALIAGGTTGFASMAAMSLGQIWWRDKAQAETAAFGELMLWTWVGHRWLGHRMRRDLAALEAGRSGRPAKVLRDLSAALEAKDPYTHGHSRRVERHALRIALEMDLRLSGGELDDLMCAAALHDVGKIEIPDWILRKQGPLSAGERAIVAGHVAAGAALVARIGVRRITEAVLHHHERWDGAGYPEGQWGYGIPLFARIIAVADAYDAMVSSRPYRASLGRARAARVLRAEAGRQFDPAVVEAFLRTVRRRSPAALPAAIILLQPSGRVVRQALAWARRVGAGSVAPAAGTVVAAAVVTQSFLPVPFQPPAPAGDHPRRVAPDAAPIAAGSIERPPQAGAESRSAGGGDRGAGRTPAPTGAPDPAASDPVVALAPARPVFDPRSEPLPAPGPATENPPDPEPPPPPAEPPPGEPPPAEEPPPPDEDPEPAPPPAEEPAPGEDSETEPDDGAGPQGDPQPDKGKDCEKDPGNGEGKDKHCGLP